jgi:predicted phage baseplate assembly protein
MPLAPLQLDNLTWEEMVAAIRRRIPAESAGNWTLHAPVDPGITLLELFAFLAEQRLYWLDQVPDSFVIAVLHLLGLEGPLPPVPAATVLQIATDSSPNPDVITVTAGTGFTRDPRREIVFTLDDTVTVIPIRGITLTATGQDRTADLLAGRGVTLLPANGGPGEARISLDLAAPVKDGYLSLFIDLDATGVPPAWAPGAPGGVPPPAQLTWSYDDAAPSPVDPAQVEDGTGGLRRSGIVRLPVPGSWNTGAGVRSLLLRTDQATFTAPPRLRRLEANVAVARDRQDFGPASLDDQIRNNWLPLPGQHLDPDPRNAPGRLLDASVTLRERNGTDHPWTPVPDFSLSGREDRVFVLDRAAGALRFGDGRTGRIPVPGSAQPGTALSTVTWTLGGGTEGNGGTTSNWRSTDGAVSATAVNPVAAVGGADAETIAQARSRAGAALHEVHRAVTAADHELIARQAPGVAVARAHAAVGDHPGYPCTLVPGAVSVYVVPHAPRGNADWDRPDFVAAPKPDPGLRTQVLTALCAARLLGEELFVRAPSYRAVRLRVEVTGTPRDPAAAGRSIRHALRRYLDPLTGGDETAGWPFGAPLRPSALLRVAQQAAGHDGDVRSVAINLDGTASWEDCRDVAIRPQELVELGDVRVRFSSGNGTTPAGGLQ